MRHHHSLARQALLAPFLTLCLCLCPPLVQAQTPQAIEVQPTLPEGYPPRMGTLSATAHGETEEFGIFDYSIGAMDAAAQFRRDLDCSGSTGECKDTGKIQLYLGANYQSDPDGKSGRLAIIAKFPRLPKAGTKTRDIRLEAIVKDQDDPIAVSVGKAVLKITEYRRGGENGSGYGHIKGTFKATLCSEGQEDCHPIAGSFDTDVQFDLPQ